MSEELTKIPQDQLTEIMAELETVGEMIGHTEGGTSYRVGSHLVTYLTDDQYRQHPWYTVCDPEAIV